MTHPPAHIGRCALSSRKRDDLTVSLLKGTSIMVRPQPSAASPSFPVPIPSRPIPVPSHPRGVAARAPGRARCRARGFLAGPLSP
ncbi:MAG: hypothetical protein BJ554DRAFT_6929 [Olpidium bornovanus]|uniref:Uncharacterized protein n=1 Tax=Olpidium bornovanus TaxID=278681 RepID=A0A8H8DM08_9FUNG|nr:MAG: hypothetical protein BJ554DRAFT_6929 [Olpidium bornovanus]